MRARLQDQKVCVMKLSKGCISYQLYSDNTRKKQGKVDSKPLVAKKHDKILN